MAMCVSQEPSVKGVGKRVEDGFREGGGGDEGSARRQDGLHAYVDDSYRSTRMFLITREISLWLLLSLRLQKHSVKDAFTSML